MWKDFHSANGITHLNLPHADGRERSGSLPSRLVPGE